VEPNRLEQSADVLPVAVREPELRARESGVEVVILPDGNREVTWAWTCSGAPGTPVAHQALQWHTGSVVAAVVDTVSMGPTGHAN